MHVSMQIYHIKRMIIFKCDIHSHKDIFDHYLYSLNGNAVTRKNHGLILYFSLNLFTLIGHIYSYGLLNVMKITSFLKSIVWTKDKSWSVKKFWHGTYEVVRYAGITWPCPWIAECIRVESIPSFFRRKLKQITHEYLIKF